MLTHYPSRIAVGAEKRIQGGGPCRDCGQSPGALHSPGCPGEECPACGALLIGCACTCLSPGEGERIIKALRDSFASPEDALQVVMGPERGREKPSYLVHAAMHALYEQLPPTAQAELQRHFSLRHPTLVPLLRDDHGHGYYSAEQLALALDIPLAEVQERIEAMVAAGQGIRFADGIVVEKVN
jgi:hypothetical protein